MTKVHGSLAAVGCHTAKLQSFLQLQPLIPPRPFCGSPRPSPCHPRRAVPASRRLAGRRRSSPAQPLRRPSRSGLFIGQDLLTPPSSSPPLLAAAAGLGSSLLATVSSSSLLRWTFADCLRHLSILVQMICQHCCLQRLVVELKRIARVECGAPLVKDCEVSVRCDC